MSTRSFGHDAAKQPAQGRNEGFESWIKNGAAAQVSDLVARSFIEAQKDLPTLAFCGQRCPPACPGRRNMGLRKRVECDAVGRERRADSGTQEVCVGHIIDMLQLASATCAEMWTAWVPMVWPPQDGPIIPDGITRCRRRMETAIVCDTISACGKANDLFHGNCFTDRPP